ncbi:hypothetical protein F5Y15DRAFT_429651 [Xylariaceae sp. FL0016]|nr:hypothetical protein F5Y15DRAFT_429651 [Xylariaceae sp. FL0016]
MSHPGSIVCRAIPSSPVTVVAVTLNTTGRLETNIVSGPKLATHTLSDEGTYVDSFTNEGLYLVYQGQALQVAAPQCDQRSCNRNQICTCALVRSSEQLLGYTTKSARTKSCPDCLGNWLRLYEAADHIRHLGMSFLASPPTLTWDENNFGKLAFHYDTELDEQQPGFSYKCPTRTGTPTGCSPEFFGYITEAWKNFLCLGGHKSDNTIAFSNFKSDDDCSSDSNSDDSGWFDFDEPLHSKSSQLWDEATHDGFDLFDSIIMEEFPKLKLRKVNTPAPRRHSSSSAPIDEG